MKISTYARQFTSVACCVVAIVASNQSPSAGDPATTIFSGSGALGIADGPAASASFIFPTQLAFDVHTGHIFVADTGAQRIREVANDGSVTTVAGSGALNASGVWVDGGFADGAALTARFDRPSGIAVGSDNSLYVADSGNHCIRRINAHNVTTFAGKAGEAGATDGSRTQARFNDPREMAIDYDGTLFVADRVAGLRKIDASGNVSTVSVPGVTFDRPVGVAIVRDGAATALFVTDALGLVRVIDGKGERVDALPSIAQQTPMKYPVSDGVPLGFPYAVTALDSGNVVYTDLRDDSVKFLRVASVLRYLGVVPDENATLGEATSQSQPMHYDAPMGITSVPGGPIFVADSGNRRIISIAPFSRRATSGSIITEASYPKGSYRVAVVGLSYTWWASMDDDSIGGFLAKKLSTVPALAGKPPVSHSFIVDMPGEFQTMDQVLTGGAADLIVVVMTPSDPVRLGAGDSPTSWVPALQAKLKQSAQNAQQNHVPLVLAVIPSSRTFFPSESAYLYEELEPVELSDYDGEHATLLKAVDSLGIPIIDVYANAREELRSSSHRQLFATGDPHYSIYGRQFVASAIYDKLLTLHPWQK